MYLWIFAALIAFFIKGLCGFANTMVFTSMLSFGTSNISISPVELVLGYPTNFILVWKNRKKLRASVYIPLAVLVLLGSIPGAFLLKKLNTGLVKIIFGILLVLLGTEMFFREIKVFKFKGSRLVLGIIGILSGIMSGLFGVGAMLAAYISRVTEDSDEFKANLCIVFMVENTFRIVFYSVLGIINPASLKLSAILLPFMLLGLFAGMKSSSFLKEKTVKIIVTLLLVASGVAMVVQNL